MRRTHLSRNTVAASLIRLLSLGAVTRVGRIYTRTDVGLSALWMPAWRRTPLPHWYARATPAERKAHSDRCNAATHAKRVAWEAAGLCKGCGGELDTDGKRCSDCRAAAVAWKRAQKERRLAA